MHVRWSSRAHGSQSSATCLYASSSTSQTPFRTTKAEDDAAEGCTRPQSVRVPTHCQARRALELSHTQTPAMQSTCARVSAGARAPHLAPTRALRARAPYRRAPTAVAVATAVGERGARAQSHPSRRRVPGDRTSL